MRTCLLAAFLVGCTIESDLHREPITPDDLLRCFEIEVDELDLGEVVVGEDGPRAESILVRNACALDVLVAEAAVKPPFGVDADLGPLLQGEESVVTVSFAPSVPGEFADELALRVETTAFRIPVSGTGR